MALFVRSRVFLAWPQEGFLSTVQTEVSVDVNAETVDAETHHPYMLDGFVYRPVQEVSI